VDKGSRRYAEKVEQVLMRDAAAVIVPSNDWAHLFAAKGARRIQVITNGFDAADFSSWPPPEPGLITYVGSYYPGMQDLRGVWDAVAAMRREGFDPQPHIRIVGDFHPAMRRDLEAAGLADAVDSAGFTSHRRALSEMARASTLLAAGMSTDKAIHKGRIPAKLFEYLGSQRPVVLVDDLSGDAAALLRSQEACYVARTTDTVAIREALTSALRFRVAVRRDLQAYDRRFLTSQLASVLNSVAASCSYSRR
jgi:glycosyltransferase involved in cell wall biosynthesis